ncbi:MAG: hypothetical protein KDK55_04230 [Chlamydiia bacterium]|nr:hypothetical protein [Chlamydiia bacterium]
MNAIDTKKTSDDTYFVPQKKRPNIKLLRQTKASVLSFILFVPKCIQGIILSRTEKKKRIEQLVQLITQNETLTQTQCDHCKTSLRICFSYFSNSELEKIHTYYLPNSYFRRQMLFPGITYQTHVAIVLQADALREVLRVPKEFFHVDQFNQLAGGGLSEQTQNKLFRFFITYPTMALSFQQLLLEVKKLKNHPQVFLLGSQETEPLEQAYGNALANLSNIDSADLFSLIQQVLKEMINRTALMNSQLIQNQFYNFFSKDGKENVVESRRYLHDYQCATNLEEGGLYYHFAKVDQAIDFEMRVNITDPVKGSTIPVHLKLPFKAMNQDDRKTICQILFRVFDSMKDDFKDPFEQILEDVLIDKKNINEFKEKYPDLKRYCIKVKQKLTIELAHAVSGRPIEPQAIIRFRNINRPSESITRKAAACGFVYKREDGKLSLVPEKKGCETVATLSTSLINSVNKQLVKNENKIILIPIKLGKKFSRTLQLSTTKKVHKEQGSENDGLTYVELTTIITNLKNKQTKRVTAYLMLENETVEQTLQRAIDERFIERDILLAKSQYYEEHNDAT